MLVRVYAHTHNFGWLIVCFDVSSNSSDKSAKHSESRDHGLNFPNEVSHLKDEARALREDMEHLRQDNKRISKSLQDTKSKLERTEDNYRQVWWHSYCAPFNVATALSLLAHACLSLSIVGIISIHVTLAGVVSEFHLLFCFDLIHTFFNDLIGWV